MSFPIKPADGAGWSIDAVPSAEGVDIVLVFDLAGVPTQVALAMSRPESRAFAHAVLAAGGDATERTFTGGSSTRPGGK